MTEIRSGVETNIEYALHCGCCGADLYAFLSVEEALAEAAAMVELDGTAAELFSVCEYIPGEWVHRKCVTALTEKEEGHGAG